MAADPNAHRDLNDRRGASTRPRRGGLLALAALLGAGLVVTAPAQAQQPRSVDDVAAPTGEAESGQLVVVYEPDARAADRAAARREAGVERIRSLGDAQVELVRPDGESSPEQTLGELRRAPGVLAADPDHIFRTAGIPDDPLFDQLWGLRNTGQDPDGPGLLPAGRPDADIDAEMAWDRTVGSPSVTVAVLDSGYRFEHPDLGPVAWTNPSEVPDNGVDDDRNGYVDDTRGWDVIDRDNLPEDPGFTIGIFGLILHQSHGVHVAGTVGASGNDAFGVSGAAQDLRIMPVRICQNLFCPLSAIIEGVAYAGRNGAQVANLSLTGYLDSAPRALTEMLAAYPSTLFVAAAGNAALDADQGDLLPFPCAIDPTEPDPVSGYEPAAGAVDNVVCVAATDRSDELASFSNFGAGSVDLAAPGVDTLSANFELTLGMYTSEQVTWTDGWTTPVPPATDQTQGFSRFPLSNEGALLISDPPPVFELPRTHERGVTRATRSPAITVAPEYRTCTAEISFTGISSGDDQLRWAVLADGVTIFERTEPDLTSLADVRQVQSGVIPLPSALSDRDVRLQVSFTRGAAGAEDAAVGFIGPRLDCGRTDHRLASGTSMATPHVAGVAGLLFSMRPSATVTEVREALLAGADPLASLAGTTVTGGRLNAWGALSALVPMDTRLLAGPTGWSSSTATFAFDSNGSGPSGFECSLDGAPHVPCTSPVTYEGLGDGLRTFSVRSSLPGGVDRTPSTLTWTVDATAPTLAPTVTPNPVRLGGTATASPGATDTGSGIAQSSCTTPATTTLGRGSVTCTATDVAGNTATSTAPYTVGVGIRWAARPTSIWPDAGLRTGVAVQLTDARGRAVAAGIARGLPSCSVRVQLAGQRPVCATYSPLTNTFVALVPTTSRLAVGTTVNLTATATLDGDVLGTATTSVAVVRR
jgi:subtilisin family serine protease